MPETPEHKISNITADITVSVALLLVALALLGKYFNVLVDWYNAFLGWVYGRNWTSWLLVFKNIFIVLSFILFGFIIYVIYSYDKLLKTKPKEKIVPHYVLPQTEVKETWEHIRELANSSNASDWNMAVLRADALLDDILGHLGYEGLTLAERLKIVDPTKLPSLDNIWVAHRLRNSIAHDPLEQNTRETIIHALRSYEQALKELGMMEEAEEKNQSGV